MVDSLLVRLAHGTAGQASWLPAGDGSTVHSGPLGSAAAAAAGRPVIVLVPGADVLLSSCTLPPTRSSAKLQQLVPYALEEQLAEDIDTLHFALGQRLPDGRLPVAVVARRRMSEWLEALRAAGIEPAALYADSELLPRNPTHAVALLEGEAMTLRTPSGAAVVVATDALGEALELALADPHTRGLLLYANAGEWQRCGAQIEALRERFERVQVHELDGDALPLLAQVLPTAGVINLLQGSFAPTRSMVSGWRAWRWAAVLLVALIGLHLIGQATELAVLHRRDHALDGAMTRVFHRAMPDAGSPYEARRRMSQRLAEVQARGGGGSFITALAALAAARSDVPRTRFELLSFSDNALQLRLTAPSIEALNRLAQSLAREGWHAKLTSANPTSGGIRGTLRMVRGS